MIIVIALIIGCIIGWKLGGILIEYVSGEKAPTFAQMHGDAMRKIKRYPAPEPTTRTDPDDDIIEVDPIEIK